MANQLGFHKSKELERFKEVEFTSKEKEKEVKVFYLVERIGTKLNLPDTKRKQAKQNFHRLKSFDYDTVLLSGALLKVACMNQPFYPRWNAFVADACKKVASEEGRVDGMVDDGWKTELNEILTSLKKQGLKTDVVVPYEYVDFILNQFSEGDKLRSFVYRNLYRLQYEDGFRNNHAAVTIGCLVYFGSRKLNCVEEVGLESVAEVLRVNPGHEYTLGRYLRELSNVYFEDLEVEEY